MESRQKTWSLTRINRREIPHCTSLRCASFGMKAIAWLAKFEISRDTGELLFKEVFECLAGVGRTTGSWLRKSGSDLCGLLVGRRCGVLFYGHAEFVEFAGVLAVFGSNALGDGLGTLKLRAGIEESALLAAVQFSVAFGAGAGGVEAGDQDGTAIGAAGAGDGADHARSARAEMIVLTAGTTLGGLAFGA